MNEALRRKKRLKRLQDDINGKTQGGSNALDAKIGAFDLYILLSEDESIKQLIRGICAEKSSIQIQEPVQANQFKLQPEANNLKSELQALEERNKVLEAEHGELDSKLKSIPPPDKLREMLANELRLLKVVQNDEELVKVWLHAESENEAEKLVRLLAVMGDWGELQALWNRLADRCKTQRRAATEDELFVLNKALALHNLRYRDSKAQLTQVEKGIAFHHETMERGTPKGSTVLAVWLPGLMNAAGKLQKQTLVQT